MSESKPEQTQNHEAPKKTEGYFDVGRFSVYEALQTGLQISFELPEDRHATLTLSPAEALRLAELVEAHRPELESDLARSVENVVSGGTPLQIDGPSAGPEPIPKVKHMTGDVRVKADN